MGTSVTKSGSQRGSWASDSMIAMEQTRGAPKAFLTPQAYVTAQKRNIAAQSRQTTRPAPDVATTPCQLMWTLWLPGPHHKAPQNLPRKAPQPVHGHRLV